MARALNGVSEPDQPERDPEVNVRITVPEEFAGVAMSEVQSRFGQIAGLDVQNQMVLIRASLRASKYEGLKNAITVWTQGKGKVEREQ